MKKSEKSESFFADKKTTREFLTYPTIWWINTARKIGRTWRGTQTGGGSLSDVKSGDCIEKIDDSNSIVHVSTFGLRCGIGTYAEYLVSALENDKNSENENDKNEKNRYKHIKKSIDCLNSKKNLGYIDARLWHLQHEFGILPKVPNIRGNTIITLHTVGSTIGNTLRFWEGAGGPNIVAYIIHNHEALDYIRGRTNKDVHVIPHGSRLWNDIGVSNARQILNELGFGLVSVFDRPVGFVFGFQSDNKKYNEMIEAAKNTGVRLIISGSTHHSGANPYIGNMIYSGVEKGAVVFLNRWLSDIEIGLFAMASDFLLFDYTEGDYSVSGALHTTVGVGRPVICSNVRHFMDINHNNQECLKFNGQWELENCIKRVVDDSKLYKKLSNGAVEFAKRTSWENVAKKHLEIYQKYLKSTTP